MNRWTRAVMPLCYELAIYAFCYLGGLFVGGWLI